jgi:hypothetical protein
MKIACFSESPPDQAALAVYVEGILGERPEPVENLDLQAHGHGGVIKALDGVIRGIHYNSDADGLVVVVDCDNTEPHDANHDAPGAAHEDCRLCQIRKIALKACKQLKPIHGRHTLKIAIGLAVPAIEAWYLVGKNHEVGEAAWKVKPPFTTAKLKEQVYGTVRPSFEHQRDCAVNEARRAIANLGAIETAFPMGFRPMAQEIRSWIAGRP